MVKYLQHMYALDCKSFYLINQYHKRDFFKRFFSKITHLGGATSTITIILCLLLFSSGTIRMTALASAISLAISHIPVAVVKRIYPRKRPYLVLENCRVVEKPLTDCSFPSGHTTAIFAIIIPFILIYPFLSFVLLPIGIAVAVSRIYLGLHYPSDVLAGTMLGTISGVVCFIVVNSQLYMQINMVGGY